MSRSVRLLVALALAGCTALILTACGSGLAPDALVSVDGTSITRTTFKHWLAIAADANSSARGGKLVLPEPPHYAACIAHLKAASPKPVKGQKIPTTAQLESQCAQQYASLQQEVLGYLISSQWVIGEAADRGVSVSDEEVKKQFGTVRRTNFPTAADFEKFLTESGYTVSDVLLRIKVNLLAERLQKKILKPKASVGRAQILSYYRQNKSRYGTREKRTVAVVLTKTDAAARSAKAELESGESFASVARRVSIDPTSKADGGLIKETVKGANQQQLDAAIFSAKVGQLSGPLKTRFGYYIYEVKRTKPASQQTLSQVQATIKQQLIATGEQQALAKFKSDFKKRWTARTDCRDGYVVADCRRFKAPRAGGAAGPTPSPTG